MAHFTQTTFQGERPQVMAFSTVKAATRWAKEGIVNGAVHAIVWTGAQDIIKQIEFEQAADPSAPLLSEFVGRG